MPVRCPLKDRFWDKVDKRGPDECWIWKGSLDRRGYGRIHEDRPGNKCLAAHRVALSLSGLDPRPDQVVMHTCDNPSCVNPAHLIAGTQSENLLDMNRKGRREYQRGEDSPVSIFTVDEVIDIRRRYDSGERIASIRRYYPKASWDGIAYVARRIGWKHIA